MNSPKNTENKKVIIVAHDGGYHTDDVFACATLSLLMEKEGKEFEIIRSRNEEVIKNADYVVDVGGEYDESRNRFDHHQKVGAGGRENGIPYASFGLVWKTYGKVICNGERVAEKIDQKLATPIDAVDNGVSLSTPLHDPIRDYGIQGVIGIFHPTWDEPWQNTDPAFMQAVTLAKTILTREIHIAQSDERAEQEIKKAYEEAHDKRLLILDTHYPAMDILSTLPEVLYIVRPRSTGEAWGVKAVRKNAFSFENRKNLPAPWAGLRGEELAQITGVPDAIFCHKALFLVTAKSKEGALKLAELALNA